MAPAASRLPPPLPAHARHAPLAVQVAMLPPMHADTPIIEQPPPMAIAAVGHPHIAAGAAPAQTWPAAHITSAPHAGQVEVASTTHVL
jgi:hypothetical protein